MSTAAAEFPTRSLDVVVVDGETREADDDADDSTTNDGIGGTFFDLSPMLVEEEGRAFREATTTPSPAAAVVVFVMTIAAPAAPDCKPPAPLTPSLFVLRCPGESDVSGGAEVEREMTLLSILGVDGLLPSLNAFTFASAIFAPTGFFPTSVWMPARSDCPKSR